MENKKPEKHLNETYLHQIAILRALNPESGSTSQPAFARHCQIGEISERSAIRDEKEVLRFLYILEGQKLVSPVPPGDFTSKTWSITKDGAKALKSIGHAVAA